MYIDEHLTQVRAQKSCDLKMACGNGLDFNAACIKPQLSKDAANRLNRLESVLTSGRADFKDRCTARNYLNNVSILAGEAAQISDCTPAFDLIGVEHARRMALITKHMFVEGEDPSKCP